MAKFTCSACMVAFDGFDGHRAHYQTDWHRVNLTRRVDGLPPITEAFYMSKVQPVAEAGVESKMERLQTSDACQTEEQFERMMQERLERDRLSLSDCLFCAQKSTTLEDNLEHMRKQHGFYIPDRAYLQDERGLLEYLLGKVAVGYCLYCPRLFNNLQDVRRHMLDTSHAKIRFDADGSAELADFYDWQDLDSSEGEDAQEVYISEDGSELITSDGTRRIGNREYWRYYKQHLREPGAYAPVGIRSNQQLVSRKMSPEEIKDQRSSIRDRMSQDLAIGEKANKLQPHFRLQIR